MVGTPVGAGAVPTEVAATPEPEEDESARLEAEGDSSEQPFAMVEASSNTDAFAAAPEFGRSESAVLRAEGDPLVWDVAFTEAPRKRGAVAAEAAAAPEQAPEASGNTDAFAAAPEFGRSESAVLRAEGGPLVWDVAFAEAPLKRGAVAAEAVAAPEQARLGAEGDQLGYPFAIASARSFGSTPRTPA